jgi:regulator of protease activity HflC (stomatin/prohibitin superfamily)
MPFINDWQTFDTRLKTLDMTHVASRGDRKTKDDLVFKTVDGNDINMDLIINWRIDPQKAPMILQEVAENDEDLKDNVIRVIGRSKPRDLFGELQTEEFYMADKRAEKAKALVVVLNTILAPYGIVVESVGTGDYHFNPEYQKAIEDRKVADQLTERHRSAKKATEEEYLKKVEDMKGDVAKVKAQADGEFEQAKIKAEAEFIKKQREAEAIRAEGLAEATAILNMNKALAGPGGEAVLKMELAKAIQGKRILLLPMGGDGLDVRSMDMNALLKTYGAKALAEKKTEAKPDSGEGLVTSIESKEETPKPAK